MARAAVALAIVYAFGYVSGSILVDPRHDRTSLAIGIVRLIAGLLLTTVVFLLCLALGVPWFSGPFGVLMIAVALNGRRALAPPAPSMVFGWSGVLGGLIVFAFLAPPVISALRMAPGEFPPVFFNVDIPYFLEKVHSLIGAETFPPESLSVAGGRRPYHFGMHGLAALISQGAGLAPHHAVFLVVVPVLSIGIVSAALVLARFHETEGSEQ